MTITVRPGLFRYDLDEPPLNWTTDFLNFEHNTVPHGHKNKAGLFFFTDSELIATEMGQCQAKGNSRDHYYLTHAIPNASILIIDFSNCDNIYHMLCLLKDLDIDVLTNEFRTYEGENTYEELRSIFEIAELETDKNEKYKHISKLKAHSESNYRDIGLFGQRLTDFDNGIKFCEIIKEKHPLVEGYRWMEYGDDRGFTYCLFSSEKLIRNSTGTIVLADEF